MSPTPPLPSALVFDLDGTLVDSQRDIADALNVALASVGRDGLTLERVRPMIGDGARALVARALGTDASAALIDQTSAAFVGAYSARPCAHTTLLPGADEALAVDLPRALLTNKPRSLTLLVLEALGIEGCFAAVYAGGDGPLKPAPDGVRAIAATLGVPVERVWLVGDGPQDVLAGRAAGCVTIAVPGIAARERVLAAGPDIALDSLGDVARLARDTLASARVTSV